VKETTVARGHARQDPAVKHLLAKLERPLETTATVILFVAVGVVIFDAVFIICDVIGRALFNYPIPGTTELVRNTVVLIIFSQAPATILEGKMLRVSAIFNRLPVGGRRWVDGISCLLAFILFVALVSAMWPEMIHAWKIAEMDGIGALKMPMAPVRTVIVALWSFTALTVLYMFIRVLSGMPPSRFNSGPGH